MIRNRVSELLGRRKENITDLARGAGISRGAAHRLYHETATGIDFTTLDRLCDYFKVDVGDILAHTPRDAESAPSRDR